MSSAFGMDGGTLKLLGYSLASIMSLGWAYYMTRNGAFGLKQKDLQDISVGVVKGALHLNKLDNIINCLDQSGTTLGDFEEAAMKFSHKDFTHIKDGFVKLGGAFQGLSTAIYSCNSASTLKEFVVLKKMISVFQDVKNLKYVVGANMLMNGIDIYKEMSVAYTNYKV